MVQSPVKFDDLAFILLFFFLMIAVISFSQNSVVGVEEQGIEDETITLFLSSDGKLSYSGQIVDDLFFEEHLFCNLELEQNVLWLTAQECIKHLADLGVEVTLAV